MIFFKKRYILCFLMCLAIMSAALYFFCFTSVEAITNASTHQSRDKYTQSQAHMSLPSIQAAIKSNYDTRSYQAIIDKILKTEELYKDTHYVFYHGMDNVWRIIQDVYGRLYQYFQQRKLLEDFVFLRFGQYYPSMVPKTFLLQQLKANGLINDHGLIGERLLSANVALFGNVGTPSECSWQYFMKSRDHLRPDLKMYEMVMDRFKLPYTYIKELMDLIDLYKTKEEMLVQIFIPKPLIDKIGYVAWIRGNPAQKDLMHWVLSSVATKRYAKTQASLDALTEIFKKEQEKNALFKSLIQEVQENHFLLSAFLHKYRNFPEQIKDINMCMARLFITSDVILNPDSGVKIIRYSTASPQALDTYHRSLDEIVSKIIASQ